MFWLPSWHLASSLREVWTITTNTNLASFRSEKWSVVFYEEFLLLLDLWDSCDL